MKKLWGSRFKGKSDPLADQFSFSISYDYRLAKYDCLSGIAHAKMLGATKIISTKETAKITLGLTKILKQIEKGTFKYNPRSEDIHTHIQSVLKNMIGDAADKLHTARSRNDLIVGDMKLYCMDEIQTIIRLLTTLQKTIVQTAKKYESVIIPAYTHLQTAQVVLLPHFLLAYVEMIERDKGRLFDAHKRTNSMPLGSCALSGTSLPINRHALAKSLNFTSVTNNSIDSVSDRDFIAEALAAIAIAGMHFSRIAEDLILWTTAEFNFISLDASLCTGSSIMPHKKNPDVLELIRGETATLYANLNRILVLLKGLPLTYNRDLQLDKPALFESVEKMKIMTQLLTKTFATLKVNPSTLSRATQSQYLYSVDIMEYLIKKGVSYRQAHDIVGKMVKECLDHGKDLNTLSESELKKYHPKLGLDVKKLLNAQTSVTIKKSFGSTNPALVNQQIKRWQKILGK